MSQLLGANRILQGPGDGCLSDYRIKGEWTVFSGADQVVRFHAALYDFGANKGTKMTIMGFPD